MTDREAIEHQLDRVLAFFPRVDAKLAGLFAVNSTLVTISALNVAAGDLTRWYIGVPAAALLLVLVLSFVELYHCNFPQLSGGDRSLIYFAEIGKRTEANYIDEYESANSADYNRDLLGQIWRNSSILSEKYAALAKAIRLTLASLVPFVWFISATAIQHSRIPLLG